MWRRGGASQAAGGALCVYARFFDYRASRLADTHCEAESLWLLGRAHGEARRLAEAAELLARSLELVRAVGDRDDESRGLMTARLTG